MHIYIYTYMHICMYTYIMFIYIYIYHVYIHYILCIYIYDNVHSSSIPYINLHLLCIQMYTYVYHIKSTSNHRFGPREISTSTLARSPGFLLVLRPRCLLPNRSATYVLVDKSTKVFLIALFLMVMYIAMKCSNCF